MQLAGIMSFGKALALVGIPSLLFMYCNWQANRSMESMMKSSHHDGEHGHHGWDEEPIADVGGDEEPIDIRVGSSGIMIWMGLMMLLSTFLFGVYVWGRGKLRERSGIPGHCCSDMLMWFFCGVCALAQEATHVERSFAPHQRVTV
jgi:Cys-rich protein (TIGR01571 family)